jgi:membrane protein required for beta-lactamase induction
VVLQLTVFWYIGAVLGHVCLGLGVLALVTMLLSWVFFFPQWGLGVCVVLWSVGCKSIQFLVHSFMHSKEPTHGLRNTHPQPTLFHIFASKPCGLRCCF